jgi:3-oxoacyl-[acyl-carrier-protein] synthase II
MTEKRRVVVTGIGAVTPLSSTAEGSWKKLINGESGLNVIDLFDPEQHPCKIAGQVNYGDGEDLFNPDNYIEPKIS